MGASVEQDTAYPGWAPNPGSAVVKLAKEVLTGFTGHDAKVCELTRVQACFRIHLATSLHAA